MNSMEFGNRHCGRSHACGGFTLMELLTVMVIAFMMMGMALAAYFGIFRSTAVQGARDNLTRVLSLSRQHAMTHRVRVYVLFRQEPALALGSTNASYRVVAVAGQHVGGNNSDVLLVGAPRWEPGSLDGGTVYNLTDGSMADVVANTADSVQGALAGGTRNAWNYGDSYGWEIHDAEYLPTTLVFDNYGADDGPNGAPQSIVFLPDGTTENTASGYAVHVREIQGPSEFAVTVRGLTGLVEGPQG